MLVCISLQYPNITVPPMGFNTWNTFQGDISEDLIRETADAMISSGLKDLGYEYLVIDDGYLLADRDENGNIIIDSSKFPSGMEATSSYVQSVGLKFGIYNSAGTATCMGLAGSFGKEEQDAKLYASFHSDYLKYDFCSNPIDEVKMAPYFNNITIDGNLIPLENVTLVNGAKLSDHYIIDVGNCTNQAEFTYISDKDADVTFQINYLDKNGYSMWKTQVNREEAIINIILDPTDSNNDGSQKVFQWTQHVVKGENKIKFFNDMTLQDNQFYSYQRMRQAMDANGMNNAVLEQCAWGHHEPWERFDEIPAQLTRTTGDIQSKPGKATWIKVQEIYDVTIKLSDYAQQGNYLHPDMLVVGLQGISDTESKTHMSLWSIMMSPLIIGTDVRNMSDSVKNVLMNRDIIAIDQDSLGIPGKRIYHRDQCDIIVKPLKDNTVAVVFFNGREIEKTDFILDLASFITSNNIQVVDETEWIQATKFECREIWNNTTVTVTNDELIVEDLKSHDSATYIIKPKL